MVLGCSLFERWVNRYLETCLNPVAAAVGEGGWSAIEGACVSFAVSLPLFVFASFGGWLAFRFGARVVVSCRVTARQLAAPARGHPSIRFTINMVCVRPAPSPAIERAGLEPAPRQPAARMCTDREGVLQNTPRGPRFVGVLPGTAFTPGKTVRHPNPR